MGGDATRFFGTILALVAMICLVGVPQVEANAPPGNDAQIVTMNNVQTQAAEGEIVVVNADNIVRTDGTAARSSTGATIIRFRTSMSMTMDDAMVQSPPLRAALGNVIAHDAYFRTFSSAATTALGAEVDPAFEVTTMSATRTSDVYVRHADGETAPRLSTQSGIRPATSNTTFHRQARFYLRI